MVVVVVVVALWDREVRPDRESGGPLEVPPKHGYMFTLPQGTRFTDSFERLTANGDRPLVLESVELVGGEGLRLLGFKILGPERDTTRDFFPEYPPALEDVKELGATAILDGPGAVIEPGNEMGWELLVGIEITQPGPLWRKGLRINYSVDGKKYTAFFPAQIQVCTEVGQKGPGGKCRR